MSFRPAVPAGLLALLVTLQPLAAQSVEAPTAAGEGEAGTPFFARDGYWLRGGFGHFDANPDPQLPGQRGHSTFFFSFGSELTTPSFLSLEFEIVSTTRTYDTAGGGFIIVLDDETSVTSSAGALGARIFLPPRAPVRVYATGGLAYVHTTFETDASFLGIPGVGNEQSDGAVRPIYGAGLQAIFGSWELHVDYRAFSLDGSFPEYEVDSVDLGGSVLAFGIGWRIPLTRWTEKSSSRDPDR